MAFSRIMKDLGISLDTPIAASVECDGYYLYCPRCYMEEIKPFTKKCSCGQTFDWEWLNNKRNAIKK